MCTFAHVIRDLVVKTKITIWAESICGISPFFFSFQKFYRTVIELNANLLSDFMVVEEILVILHLYKYYKNGRNNRFKPNKGDAW